MTDNDDLNKPDDTDKGIPGWGKRIESQQPQRADESVSVGYSIKPDANLVKILSIVNCPVKYGEKPHYGNLISELDKAGVNYDRDTFGNLYANLPKREKYFWTLIKRLREDPSILEAVKELKRPDYGASQ